MEEEAAELRRRHQQDMDELNNKLKMEHHEELEAANQNMAEAVRTHLES